MKRWMMVIAVAGIAIFGAAAWFGWRNLRGIGPAIRPPAEDISKVLPSVAPAPATSESENITGLPLRLPPGFSISVFAKGLDKPRVLVRDPNGTLLVSDTDAGRVVALPDVDRDGVADRAVTVASGLDRPHGLAFRCADRCRLYIAETDQVAVWDYDAGALRAGSKKKIIDLPDNGDHFTRTILFLPPPDDDKLLISVGSDCNVCREDDARRAKILIANADGRGLRAFVSGLRNAVFMALHPATGKVWATEMGRDLLGDNLPPDEIDIIEDGKNYGWPICYGKNIHDTDFDKNVYVRNPCLEPFETPSYIDIPAHSAPLGLAFAPADGWPEEYRDDLLVAYHGSWNRSMPTGYKIVRARLDADGNFEGFEDFITGWLRDGGTALGRPVDILIDSGGVMYISDDKAGVIYRVTYGTR